MRYVLAVALTFGLLTSGSLLGRSEAHANGRFPLTNALFFAPNDPNYILLRTTFGEMISQDHGKTWDWVCEQSVGLAGVEDPMFAITPNGTLITSTFQGLALSHDKACNFGFVGGSLDLVFADLTNRPSTPGSVVAFASSYGGTGDAGVFYKSKLYETTDQGDSFFPLDYVFDGAILGETVDVCESDPDRIYVSALRDPDKASISAVLLTSRDHGKTFTEAPIALVNGEHAAFIAAVDPTNADRVYVRTSNATGTPTRLLVSDDAGKTFRTLFTGMGAVQGFALTADGTRVYVGGPNDGLWAASTADFKFTQISQVEIGCLKLNADGLWACSSEKSGFVVGLSTDQGSTFKPVLHFCDIRGPLECGADSSTYVQCSLGGANNTPPWPAQRSSLGCPDPSDDAGTADAGPDAAVTAAMPSDGGGCSVRAPGPTPFAALVAGIAAVVALLRRRRR